MSITTSLSAQARFWMALLVLALIGGGRVGAQAVETGTDRQIIHALYVPLPDRSNGLGNEAGNLQTTEASRNG